MPNFLDPISVLEISYALIERADPCQDVADLCLRTDLGLSGAAYWGGEIEDPRASRKLRFRLWSDGRKRKYLLAATDAPKGSPQHRVSLNASGEKPQLCGVTPKSWNGSEAELMDLALGLVAKIDGRIHWRRARRVLKMLTL